MYLSCARPIELVAVVDTPTLTLAPMDVEAVVEDDPFATEVPSRLL